MKKFTLLFVLVLLIGIGSCKKKDDLGYCNSNWATALTNEMNAMVTAALTYGTNPTTANCTAYKTAISKYIDALEPWGDCPLYASVTNKAQFDAAIAEARAELNNACQ